MAAQPADMFDMAALIKSFDDITELIDLHFENIARSLRQTFYTASWLPDLFKRSPSSAPSFRSTIDKPSPLPTISSKWISKNRVFSATILAFVSISIFTVRRRKRCDEKYQRRAKRARNGARIEVVVVAGSPYSKLTKLVALDLERRGFIIYITVSTIAQEQTIMAYSNSNIRSLNIDVTSVGFAYADDTSVLIIK